MIIITLVLIYGYNAIQGFISKSDDVNYVQFKTDLFNAVETQKTEYRSVIKKEMMLPRGYTEIVVIDSFFGLGWPYWFANPR